MSRVTIVDYGLGNMHSVAKSFEHLGCEVEIAVDPSLIAKAQRLVLPGVGAFADGMAGLHARNLVPALREYGRQDRPLLGICLGAQLLLESSEEFGRHEGLGIIAGSVRSIPSAGVKIPHVGWARLLPPGDSQGFGGILQEIPSGTWAYFIHSYQMLPAQPEYLSAVCRHGPNTLNASVQRGSIHGTQFHPEKSGQAGLTMLRAFAFE